jgi:hypothetical protein
VTPAQVSALLAGPSKPVRIDALKLLSAIEVRRAARRLRVTPGDLVCGLACVWGWQAARWSPSWPWGDGVPVAVADALLRRPGACGELVAGGLGTVQTVAGELVLVLVPLDGAPNIRVSYVVRERGRKGARVAAQRRAAHALPR